MREADLEIARSGITRRLKKGGAISSVLYSTKTSFGC
jgi:hypothetical protein